MAGLKRIDDERIDRVVGRDSRDILSRRSKAFADVSVTLFDSRVTVKSTSSRGNGGGRGTILTIVEAVSGRRVLGSMFAGGELGSARRSVIEGRGIGSIGRVSVIVEGGGVRGRVGILRIVCLVALDQDDG